MLEQRVITAIVLLAILLPALFYESPTPFCALALLMIAAGAWEWGRLNTLGHTASLGLSAVTVCACALAWYSGLLEKSLPVLWAVSGAGWVLVGAWLLHAGVAGWPRIPKALRLVGGVAALCLAWLAIAQARVMGIEFLLSLLVLVWVADISAYFAGRAFGLRVTKSRLAPSISPGKSWEGVWGGMVGVIGLALAWFFWGGDSLYSQMSQRHGLALMLLAVIFLAGMSVVGDLVESLIKRSAGVKDSSGLLPGHGGILDRVDALLPALPLAMMLVTV